MTTYEWVSAVYHMYLRGSKARSNKHETVGRPFKVVGPSYLYLGCTTRVSNTPLSVRLPATLYQRLYILVGGSSLLVVHYYS